jgi:hypothetical protein
MKEKNTLNLTPTPLLISTGKELESFINKLLPSSKPLTRAD